MKNTDIFKMTVTMQYIFSPIFKQLRNSSKIRRNHSKKKDIALKKEGILLK